MTNENAAFIQSQIALLKQTMLTLLAPGEEYALIDFPDHGNVGDSAIWLGEIEVLTQVAPKRAMKPRRVQHRRPQNNRHGVAEGTGHHGHKQNIKVFAMYHRPFLCFDWLGLLWGGKRQAKSQSASIDGWATS